VEGKRGVMKESKRRPGIRVVQLLAAWKSILSGSSPMLSIELTRECPLHCPGCYAYGEDHLGGDVTLRGLQDYRGDELVERVLDLVRRHRPLHLSLVGGEPLIRVRELNVLLPKLSRMGVHTMVVTSAVVPIPARWTTIPEVTISVSVDGLPEHHDPRRTPATYRRILANINGCKVNIHWTITAPMLQRPGYVEEYLSFWSARAEVVRIWTSLYTPQIGERSAEMLDQRQRQQVATTLRNLEPQYPKLLMNAGIAQALVSPPLDPNDCMFARMSTNYSADLQTRVEPCVFGGNPDCSNCGCAISSGLHGLKKVRILQMMKIESLVNGSVKIGSLMRKLKQAQPPTRWTLPSRRGNELIQISGRPE
jgi:organic radical activating enzyme